MLRPTSDGVRYARLYASFAAQFGHAPSHFAETSNPDASSHTDGAAVLLVPKPVPLIVTVALCDHCPELLRMDGCAATAVDHRITAQANARRPLVEGFRIASARAKPFPPQATAFRPIVRVVAAAEDRSLPARRLRNDVKVRWWTRRRRDRRRHIRLDLGRCQRAVVDPHFVDDAREVLAPHTVSV